jgi:hypothetical protein
LVHACGAGKQRGGTSISTKALDFRDKSSIKYPFGEFSFLYLGKYNNATRERCNEESPSCTASYILDTAIRNAPSTKVWNLDMQIKYPEQALEFVQPIPCMFSQVQLLNSQPSLRQSSALGSDTNK